ncbi:hypothetical protein [Paenibacillus tianjinensis]|uniref:Uncharacterized protein n=1 Tax=Paenibacillus tianjinensis TaxID=2810347 RepID=A0ABX7L630_9BACL|nr:hypothetical protein [Paenibacillus tianjinensis]QSF42676.1 hypothetical protein JRJ22_15270 [Paenibacillus tianjinensis]
MPDIGGMMSGAIWAVIKSIALYMVLPTFAVGLILKLFRVNGGAVKFLMGAVALVGLYFLFTHGFPGLLDRIQEGIEQGSSK